MASNASFVVEMVVNLQRWSTQWAQASKVSDTRLREIQRSTDRTVRSIQSAGNKLQNALGTVGIGLSIAGIAVGLKNLAREAIKYGDEIQKAALRTGVTASQFALMAEAAKLADVDMDSLSKGLRAMQVQISALGTGNKEAVKTFTALGIGVGNLANLKADQQLKVIADQLTRVKDDADRTALGVAIFGRAWQDLAPFLLQGAKGIEEAATQVRALGNTLTDQQIQKLADADDAIKRLDASWTNFARTLTAKVAPALTELFDAFAGNSLEGVEASLALQMAKLKDFERYGADPKQIAALKENISLLRQQRAAMLEAAGIGQGGPTSRTVFPQGLPAPPGPTGGGAGKDTRTAAERLGLSDIAISVQRITVGAMQQLYDGMNKATQTAVEAQLEEWNTFESQVQTLVDDGIISAAEGAARMSEYVGQALEEVQITAERLEVPQAFSKITEFARQAAENMQDAFSAFLFDPFSEGLKGMLSGFVDMIRRMVAELLANEILTAFFSWAGGAIGGSIGKFVGSLGQRASGGPVMPGGAYIVGERGPELFVPRSAGTIVPNGSGGVMLNQNISIDARGADAERIMALMPGWGKAIKDQTIQAMIQLQRQGRFA